MSNKLNNMLLGIFLIIMVLSGALHSVLLPLGVYRFIHLPAAYLFLLNACIHIWKHRKWIKKVYFT